MKKIMYIQNVPWSWIKQRPHFIAEGLAEYYQVDVYYKKAYNHKNKVDNDTNKVKLYELFRLPFERYLLIEKLSNWIVSKQLLRQIEQYDIIWLSDPRTYAFIYNYIDKHQTLIFDCMDDYAEFTDIKNNSYAKVLYRKAEKKLLDDCNFVFVSSNFLKETLLARNEDIGSDKFFVLNNAICTDKIYNVQNKKVVVQQKANKKIITYIGTISYWFDFDIILKSLQREENIVYYLYGPKDVEIPKHDRIVYQGILKHEQIFSVMEQSDLLVMPFQLTKLVLSVDPVKIYEYIYSKRPTMVVRYSETEKFASYTYLYANQDEYFDIMHKLVYNQLFSLKSNDEIDLFVMNNTWDQRVREVVSYITTEE